MRKILLIIVFGSSFYFPAFSQFYKPNPTDTLSGNLSTYLRSLQLYPLTSRNFIAQLNKVNPEKNSIPPNYTDRNFLLGLAPDILISPYDEMPCLIPKGNFPMLISKPDSSVQYTLRIKRP